MEISNEQIPPEASGLSFEGANGGVIPPKCPEARSTQLQLGKAPLKDSANAVVCDCPIPGFRN